MGQARLLMGSPKAQAEKDNGPEMQPRTVSSSADPKAPLKGGVKKR